MSLHPEVQALLKAMRELEYFLADQGQSFWAIKVKDAADLVANSDARGVSKFLEFFGGMGSLNDILLLSHGRTLDAENKNLDLLRSRAWELAWQLRHEAQ
jgi:hypothetical protein